MPPSRDVAAFDGAEPVVVAGELPRLVHLQIGQKAVAGTVFHVVRGGREEGSDRLCLKLAHQGRIVANGTKHGCPTSNAVRAIRPGSIQQSDRKFLVRQCRLGYQFTLWFIFLPVMATASLNR